MFTPRTPLADNLFVADLIAGRRAAGSYTPILDWTPKTAEAAVVAATIAMAQAGVTDKASYLAWAADHRMNLRCLAAEIRVLKYELRGMDGNCRAWSATYAALDKAQGEFRSRLGQRRVGKAWAGWQRKEAVQAAA